jgi:hypothetical protein
VNRLLIFISTLCFFNFANASTWMQAIVTDSRDAVYAVGMVDDFWTVRKSTDQGTSWKQVDRYRCGQCEYSTADMVAISGSTVVVVGHEKTGWYQRSWIVRMSTDWGETWRTADQYTPPGWQAARGVVITPQGDIYVSGESDDQDGVLCWLTRKSSDHGATWSNVDAFSYVPGNSTLGRKITASTDGKIYVVGYGDDSQDNAHWLVRMSDDGGATWTTVDDYVYETPSSLDTYPSSIALAPNGQILVVGTGGWSEHWIVRTSEDGGKSWRIADDFVGSTIATTADDVVVDSSGRIFVTGDTQFVGGIHNWITRVSVDAGLTWTTVDDSRGANAEAIGVTPSGIIFTAGEGNGYNWYIKKSEDFGSNWVHSD